LDTIPDNEIFEYKHKEKPFEDTVRTNVLIGLIIFKNFFSRYSEKGSFSQKLFIEITQFSNHVHILPLLSNNILKVYLYGLLSFIILLALPHSNEILAFLIKSNYILFCELKNCIEECLLFLENALEIIILKDLFAFIIDKFLLH
jgi:hypothetical protein